MMGIPGDAGGWDGGCREMPREHASLVNASLVVEPVFQLEVFQLETLPKFSSQFRTSVTLTLGRVHQ